MKIPLRLAHSPTRKPTAALLLPKWDTEELFRVCERFPSNRFPDVYATADGFLVYLPESTLASAPGLIRLAEVTKYLLLPIDADLVPTLEPDEAEGLVAKQGLVFLPGDRVLSFDRASPISVSSLVGVPELHRRNWRTFPETTPLANRIAQITFDLPPTFIQDMFGQVEDDIGTETPEQPPGLSQSVGAQTNFQMGRFLAWLGKVVHSPWLVHAGANFMGKAMDQIPKLSESLFGKQDASLRRLLQMFREGNTEEALKRALPIGGDNPRGSRTAQNAHLPAQNVSYSLSSILGGGSGTASLWFGGSDEVYRELTAHYRRLAVEAARKGDHRRAAYIYGKLLNEYRSAANVLTEGGLYLDAAVIYQKKLNDSSSAARAYEAGGEFDRAIRLYQQIHAHKDAGRLLRMIGEEEEACGEYVLAAQQLANGSRDYYAAGQLLLKEAQRPDLALDMFQQGWTFKPTGEYVSCGCQLVVLAAQEGQFEKVLQLVDEAGEFFQEAGSDVHLKTYFTHIAKLAEQEELSDIRDDLKDKSLMALAYRVRTRVSFRSTGRQIVTDLMGTGMAYHPAVLSDARFAVDRLLKHQVATSSGDQQTTRTKIPARTPIITAVCDDPRRGVFVGFESGEVWSYNPNTGRCRLVTDINHPILSMTLDPHDNVLYVLSQRGAKNQLLTGWDINGDSSLRCKQGIPTEVVGWMFTPRLLASEPHTRLGDLWIWRGNELHPYIAEWLTPGEVVAVDRIVGTVGGSHFLHSQKQGTLVGFSGKYLWFAHVNHRRVGDLSFLPISVPPEVPSGSHLQTPHMSFASAQHRHVEMVGTSSFGHLLWLDLKFAEDTNEVTVVHERMVGVNYLTATLVRAGLIAAVKDNCIDWFRIAEGNSTLVGHRELNSITSVACHASWGVQQVVIVCQDGSILHIPHSF
ncbi:MAG: tetratricopeptide repeat protein [Gemmataceae bacterium]